MTEISTAHIGSYPRIGETKDAQRHRRALTHLQNGDISAHAFRDVVQSLVQEVIREQIEAGIDETTDGLVSWSDPISHFCQSLSGVTFGGLFPYFGLNFYYRRPIISGAPKRKKSVLLPEFQFAKHTSNKPVRVVMTGPFTLAHHVVGEKKPFHQFKSRAQLFGEILEQEIKDVVGEGATLIQIDEPALALYPDETTLFKKMITAFSLQKKSAQLILALPHSPVFPLISSLAELPVDRINLSVVDNGKKILDKFAELRSQFILEMGCVQATQSRLDPIDPLLGLIRTYLEKKSPNQLVLTPSAGLEFLPRDSARAKLSLLAKLKQELAVTPSLS